MAAHSVSCPAEELENGEIPFSDWPKFLKDTVNGTSSCNPKFSGIQSTQNNDDILLYNHRAVGQEPSLVSSINVIPLSNNRKTLICHCSLHPPLLKSDEIVLMPRSSGGFIYGIATLDYSVENCAFDSSVSHSTKMYAFEYSKS